MTPKEAYEAREAPDPTLWAVSIQGPDDIIASADHLSAVKIANTFNRFWQQMKEKAPQRLHDPRMWAVPVEWPYTAESHAESLVSGPGPDYDEMVKTALSALDLSAIGAEGWRDISTCPKDGSHFLARQVVIADEYDEDDRIIRKGVREEFTVVAYWVFGGVVQFPWNGGMPSNVTYILWRPLPSPLETRS